MLMRNGDLISTDIEKAEVFATHKQIVDLSISEKNFGAARAANRDLMEVYEMFPKEEKKTENELILAMEKKLNGETKAIAMATGSEMVAMLWEGKKMFEMKKQEKQLLEIGGQDGQGTSNTRSIQEQEAARVQAELEEKKRQAEIAKADGERKKRLEEEARLSNIYLT